jgi:hypothetical protein
MELGRSRTLGAICLICIIILLTACAGTQVNITTDGTPLPKHITRLSNPETEISVTISLVRQFLYTEGKETAVMPEYLPFSNLYTVDSENTKSLVMAIHVHNPKRAKYEIWESHKFWYPQSQYPTHMQRCFYSGSMSIKDFRINLPLEEVRRAASWAELRDPETGRVLIHLGDAIYQLKGGNAGQ